MSESGPLKSLSILAAKWTPMIVKKWVHRNRLLDRFVHRTFARFASVGGAMVTIQSGPLAGLHLEMGEHVLSSHITGIYERKTQLAIDRLVQPGAICYDSGASIGYFSLLMARKASCVYAFEPAPHAAAEIRKHAAANGFQNITVVESPVSDSEREVRFSLTDVAYGSRIMESDTKWPTLTLITITLDVFAKTHPSPDFLKIDVEGEEARVLSGAKSILRDKKPVICCELHSEMLAKEVENILTENGYRLTTLDGEPFHAGGMVVEGDLQVLALPS
jgi:FkbM family methyltransferase